MSEEARRVATVCTDVICNLRHGFGIAIPRWGPVRFSPDKAAEVLRHAPRTHKETLMKALTATALTLLSASDAFAQTSTLKTRQVYAAFSTVDDLGCRTTVDMTAFADQTSSTGAGTTRDASLSVNVSRMPVEGSSSTCFLTAETEGLNRHNLRLTGKGKITIHPNAKKVSVRVTRLDAYDTFSGLRFYADLHVDLRAVGAPLEAIDEAGTSYRLFAAEARSASFVVTENAGAINDLPLNENLIAPPATEATIAEGLFKL